MKKVLMIGPARDVKGGMTTVVDNYYKYGLNKQIELKYIETINDKGKIHKFLKERKGFFEFKKCIKNYDVVHIHMASKRSTFRKSKYVRIAKKHNKKVIIHLHGGAFKEFFSKCNIKQQQYIKETFNLADKIIVLSEEWGEYIEKLVEDKKKITIIYNSIIIPNDFDKDVDTQSFLFLGRIEESKGIYDLLDVFKKVINKFPEVHLYIGGNGEKNKLEKIIKEDKLEKNVSYIGWIEGKEKEEYLKKCSIYCLPSYNEGMPMSVLEAMAYKNIVITTDVGGIPKVITNNLNGFLIKPGDKEKLLQTIKKILSDTQLRKRISVNARKTVIEKFDINNNINKLIDLYKI